MTPAVKAYRKAGLAAGGVLALLVVAIAAGEAAGWPFLQRPLERAMSRAAGVPVQLGPVPGRAQDGGFRASLIGHPGLRVDHLKIGAASGIGAPHLLEARDVALDWRWGDVLRWRRGAPLRIHRLQAAQVDAHLVRLPDGRASWQLGTRAPADDAAHADLQDTLPRFGSLRIGEGLIVVDDQPLDTRLRVRLEGGEGEPVEGAAALSGTAASAPPPAEAPRSGYRAVVEGRWHALPLDLQVRSGSTLPLLQDGEGDEAPDVPVRVEGRAGAAQLLFDGHAAALLGERRLRGQLRFQGPSLARVGAPLGLTLPESPPFELQGQIGHAGGVWHLRADRAAIGRSLLNGEFRYDTRTQPGRLTGRLGGPRLRLGDLGPAVGNPAEARRSAGKVLPQRRFDLPSLRAMDADVTVAVDELDFGSEAVAPLRRLRSHVLLQAGVLQLQDLQAEVAGGRFGGSTRLDSTTTPARWGADLEFSGIDIAGWLPGVRADAGRDGAARGSDARSLKRRRDAARQGADEPVRAYLTGTLGGQIQATGQGSSTAEILGSLDGSARALVRDGTLSHLVTELAGLDVAQALGVVVRSDHPLPLRCARVDLQLQQGVARIRRAVLDNADSTIRVGGEINLRQETLALRAATKPKDFSLLSLRTPVVVGGTLAKPEVGIEGRRLAGRVLGALALGAVAGPAAAMLPLVDPGEKEAGDPCAVAPATPARKP